MRSSKLTSVRPLLFKFIANSSRVITPFPSASIFLNSFIKVSIFPPSGGNRPTSR
eukprot:CAMPEP_0169142606 /NCGR_PEP_ID=MMETSP1015-20121227/45066_1 /TAXON_ID=342587 /ORGANISM="Karlodinium micrum, Strain CCMP2283" /LENGTH=54 /DNA_ID=CAMNT_0009209337 /DNA_START=23 /DNA_END=183 /DNA_ORIENTATION=+